MVKLTFYAGTKNVTKALLKIVLGKENEIVKAEELVDKSKCRTSLCLVCWSSLYLFLL